VAINMEILKMEEAGSSETLAFIKLRQVNIPLSRAVIRIHGAICSRSRPAVWGYIVQCACECGDCLIGIGLCYVMESKRQQIICGLRICVSCCVIM